MGIVNRSISRMDLRLLVAVVVLIGPPLGLSRVYLVQTKDDQDKPITFDTKGLSDHHRRQQPQVARGFIDQFEQNEEEFEAVNDQPENYNKEVPDEANVSGEDYSNAQNGFDPDQNDELVESSKDHNVKSESYVYTLYFPKILNSSETKNDFVDNADPTEKASQMASDDERNYSKDYFEDNTDPTEKAFQMASDDERNDSKDDFEDNIDPTKKAFQMASDDERNYSKDDFEDNTDPTKKAFQMASDDERNSKDAKEESVQLSEEENLDYSSAVQDYTSEKVESNIHVEINNDNYSTEDDDKDVQTRRRSKDQVGRKNQSEYYSDSSNASAITESGTLEENEDEVENVEQETSQEYSMPENGFLHKEAEDQQNLAENFENLKVVLDKASDLTQKYI